MLTAAALLLAGGTISALVGLFHVPFLASLGHVSLARVLEVGPVVVPLSGVAGAALAVQLVLLVRRWAQHRSLLGRAWRSVDEGAGTCWWSRATMSMPTRFPDTGGKVAGSW